MSSTASVWIKEFLQWHAHLFPSLTLNYCTVVRYKLTGKTHNPHIITMVTVMCTPNTERAILQNFSIPAMKVVQPDLPCTDQDKKL